MFLKDRTPLPSKGVCFLAKVKEAVPLETGALAATVRAGGGVEEVYALILQSLVDSCREAAARELEDACAPTLEWPGWEDCMLPTPRPCSPHKLGGPHGRHLYLRRGAGSTQMVHPRQLRARRAGYSRDEPLHNCVELALCWSH